MIFLPLVFSIRNIALCIRIILMNQTRKVVFHIICCKWQFKNICINLCLVKNIYIYRGALMDGVLNFMLA